MEINVTELVNNVDCEQFAASIAESGLQNIGEITWNNAVNHVAVEGLVSAHQQDELREYIRAFGAWDDLEIAAMSDRDTNALLLQFIAGDIREMEGFDNEDDYQDAQQAGQVSGSLYPDEHGEWFYYAGN